MRPAAPRCPSIRVKPTTAWTLFLFTAVAAAKIFGCDSGYLWLNLKRSPLWLLPGAVSLALFAWLLTLHPSVAGLLDAAYGGVSIAASLAWLKWVDGHSPDRWDFLGAAVCLLGAAIICFAPRAGA